MRAKVVTVLLCVVGVGAVSYGIIKENHPIFITGLTFVIGGYLLIRRKLKASIRDKS